MENVPVSDEAEFFKPIDTDDPEQSVTEIESLCVNCGENGTTRLLMVKIPFFKETILSSFHCPACNFRNNETQTAGELQKQGVELVLTVSDLNDLNRQVLTSEYSEISIPELELEIPCGNQKGALTTIEGILDRVINGLKQEQPIRKITYPREYQKILEFINKIESCKTAKQRFTVKVRDISGRSVICTPANVLPGHKDDALTVSHFDRSKEQDIKIGYFRPEDIEEKPPEAGSSISTGQLDTQNEVLQFEVDCPSCRKRCSTKMKLTLIPNFKEVVIMATDCDACGYRSNEVKSGGPIEPKGKKITLKVTSTTDLTRDVLKSETCSVKIPEVELEIGGGAIGGKFTTLEGLLIDIKNLVTEENPLVSGDSASSSMREKMENFKGKLDKLITCESPFEIEMDDPAGNSYLQSLDTPNPDPNLKIEKYDRSFDQNEALGLNDIKV